MKLQLKFHKLLSLTFLICFYACDSYSRNFKQGVDSMTADAKLIGYSICVLMLVVAGVIVGQNLYLGLTKAVSIYIGVIIISTAVGTVAYFAGMFG